MTIEERLKMPVEEIKSVNIREYIRRRMNERGITVYRMAKVLGVPQPNLANALNERIPLPLERLEKILWILEGDDFLK